ncbi:cytochrome P450 4C1 [Halyomorpha halys]|uniref:cytochrome P450 4C1 n=1 Tax=Halyomorpha halys TaxID=286706 RepID=UPI0006D5262A|nr:cytochrome P450 4C1-like [Halyomorpha halys]
MVVILILFSILFTLLINRVIKDLLKTKGLPGPWELPLLAELRYVFKPFSVLYPVLKTYIDKYGGVCVLYRTGQVYVMLSEPETVEPILISSNHIKKGDYDYAFLRPWLRDGLLLSDGSKWRNRRKLLTPAFHFKILEDGMKCLTKKSEEITEKLLATNGKPTDLDDIIRSSTLGAILETAMGVPSSDAKEYQEYQHEYQNKIKGITESIMKRYYRLWKHIESLYRLSSEGKEFFKDVDRLQSFTKKVIKDRKQLYLNERNSKTEDKKHRVKPFLDCLIELDISSPGAISEDGICEEVDTFMFEGHDTTASALNSALFLLANNPAEQEKAAEEQIEIFGDDNRLPTTHDLNRMEYLDMVIKEVLRLYPSVPIITRSLTEDLKIDENITIPAGCIVAIMPYFVHRSEKHWDNPEEFRPERFTPGISRHPFAFIPFSAGPRNCIGQKFAMMEMKTMLSAILRKCRLEPVTTSFEIVPTVVLKSDQPIIIKVLPRS